MFPKIISLVILVCLLAACAAPATQTSEVFEASEVSTPTAFPTETPTPTPEATPTPEYNVDAEYARQLAIIENAPNRQVDFEYLNSPEYLKWLEDKNKNGEFPQISPNANFVEAGDVNLRYETLENEPSNFFEKYGADNAVTFERSWRWRLQEKKPWTVVDAGVTEIGKSKAFFYVLKWRNSDGSEAFWGRVFTSIDGQDITHRFLETIDRSGIGYPSVAYFKSVNACIKGTSKYTSESVTDFCTLLGTNPDSAIPKDAIQNWRETGNLKLNFLPWSQSTPHLLK